MKKAVMKEEATPHYGNDQEKDWPGLKLTRGSLLNSMKTSFSLMKHIFWFRGIMDFAQLFEQPQHLAEEMFWGWMYYNGLEPLSLCRRNNEFRHMHLLIHYQKRFSTHFANASRMQEDFPRSHKSEKSSFFFLKTK